MSENITVILQARYEKSALSNLEFLHFKVRFNLTSGIRIVIACIYQLPNPPDIRSRHRLAFPQSLQHGQLSGSITMRTDPSYAFLPPGLRLATLA